MPRLYVGSHRWDFEEEPTPFYYDPDADELCFPPSLGSRYW